MSAADVFNEDLAAMALRLASQASEEAQLEVLAGQHRALVEEMSAIPIADRLKLKAAGYVPVVNWQSANGICGTGSALKTLEIKAAEAACGASQRGHVRDGYNGRLDYCNRCGVVMPWTSTR